MKTEEIRHNFAQNIIKLRKSRGLSQIELGEAIHYSSKAISKWENEETMPDIEVIYSVASYFDVTIDELISDKDVVRRSYKKRNHFFITLSSAILPFFIALIIFFFLTFAKIENAYLSFLVAGMASAITLIVFTRIWYHKLAIYLSIVYLIIVTTLLIMILLQFHLWWLLLIIAVVLMALFFVFFMIYFPSLEKRGK